MCKRNGWCVHRWNDEVLLARFWFWYRTIAVEKKAKCLFILFASFFSSADSYFRSLLLFASLFFASSVFFLVCAQIIWNGNDTSRSLENDTRQSVDQTSPSFHCMLRPCAASRFFFLCAARGNEKEMPLNTQNVESSSIWALTIQNINEACKPQLLLSVSLFFSWLQWTISGRFSFSLLFVWTFALQSIVSSTIDLIWLCVAVLDYINSTISSHCYFTWNIMLNGIHTRVELEFEASIQVICINDANQDDVRICISFDFVQTMAWWY